MAQETGRFSFKAVFVAVVLGLAIVLAAFLFNMRLTGRTR